MIKYSDVDKENINILADLWNKNKAYHLEIETYFKKQYSDMSFDRRMKEILGNANREIKITIAEEENNIIGYCISGIINHEGEIISIHVRAENRGCGVGKRMLKRHLDWLRINGCKKIGIFVSNGNVNSIAFYEKIGFVKNLVYMEMPKEE